jgi:hypothetical protein
MPFANPAPLRTTKNYHLPLGPCIAKVSLYLLMKELAMGFGSQQCFEYCLRDIKVLIDTTTIELDFERGGFLVISDS